MCWSCFSHIWLCNPMDCSPPGSSVHGILQARELEWVATPSSRGSSHPGIHPHLSCTGRRFFTTSATREAQQNSVNSPKCFTLITHLILTVNLGWVLIPSPFPNRKLLFASCLLLNGMRKNESLWQYILRWELSAFIQLCYLRRRFWTLNGHVLLFTELIKFTVSCKSPWWRD